MPFTDLAKRIALIIALYELKYFPILFD